MSTGNFNIDDLRKLSRELAAAPDKCDTLSPDEATALRRYLNPLGNVVSSKKCYANVSVVNLKERYFRHLHVTALVGFMYRLLSEYVPAKELAAAGLSPDSDAGKRMTRSIRNAIKGFLDRNLEYDTDRHTRKEAPDPTSDPEKQPREEALRCAREAAIAGQTVENKLSQKQDMTFCYAKSSIMTCYQNAVSSAAALKNVIGVLDTLPQTEDLGDARGILLAKYAAMEALAKDMRPVADSLSAAQTILTWEVQPPAEVFYHFDRYITNNYERLRAVCDQLYAEKFDIEHAVILYDAFKTAEAAEDHITKHNSEFRMGVFTVESGSVSLLGPFKENRERVNYYNKNTKIMELMMSQVESDHKLGKDIMEKGTKAKKVANIAAVGPDGPGLTGYVKSAAHHTEYQVKKVLTDEELANTGGNTGANAGANIDDCPPDCVEVDMYCPVEEDGQTVLKKSTFYTQAEAPLHKQEGSEFVSQYQPKRTGGAPIELTTKKIIGRHGQELTINVPVRPENSGTLDDS